MIRDWNLSNLRDFKTLHLKLKTQNRKKNIFYFKIFFLISERERQRLDLHLDGHRRRSVQGHRLPALEPRFQATNQGNSNKS